MPLSHTQIKKVAAIYDRAAGKGGNPTKEVAHTLDLAYPTAQKHVMRAREWGYLPQTTERKRMGNTTTGKHRSVQAEIGRGTPDYIKYRACPTCRVEWPCPHA